MILDSGNRSTFETGATRDIQDGKGRPCLMPLEVASAMLGGHLTGGDCILHDIHAFIRSKKTTHLYAALHNFAEVAFGGSVETMLLEVSIHFEEGARKYGPNNWRKGLPVTCYVDSAIRHYLKYRRGDKDENHNRAFVWNVMACIWEVDHHERNKEDTL